jgi:hypothetical protein
MTVYTWDTDRFDAAGVSTYERDDAAHVAYFVLPPNPDRIAVRMDGETLKFTPERSSGHRRLIGRLASSG